MKRILFGGPEEGDPHRDLVSRLDDGYNVMYANDGVGMLWELDPVRLSVDEHARPYDLIIYDTRLFWGSAERSRREDLFCSQVVHYLALPQKPVIILADDAIDGLSFRRCSREAGFVRFSDPYRVDVILDAVHSLLYPNA